MHLSAIPTNCYDSPGNRAHFHKATLFVLRSDFGSGDFNAFNSAHTGAGNAGISSNSDEWLWACISLLIVQRQTTRRQFKMKGPISGLLNL